MGDVTVPDRVHAFRQLELPAWLESVALGGAEED